MRLKYFLLFIICLLVVAVGYLFYQIVDKGVTISYMKEGYSDTEDDLNSLIQINNSKLNTKFEIREFLEGNENYVFLDFDSDTVELNRISLIFKNDSLKRIDSNVN